jgi:hypothetical protein
MKNCEIVRLSEVIIASIIQYNPPNTKAMKNARICALTEKIAVCMM